MALSVEAGHPVPSDRSATFADGMAVRVAVPLAVEEIVRLGVPFVQVSERRSRRRSAASPPPACASRARPLRRSRRSSSSSRWTARPCSSSPAPTSTTSCTGAPSSSPRRFPTEPARPCSPTSSDTCAARTARAELALDGAVVRCDAGHAFDVARQGYVSLLPGAPRPRSGDTAEMVAARAAFLGAGHFDPLARRSWGGRAARRGLRARSRRRHRLAARARARLAARERHGIALDVSRPALQRAARAHARIGAVGCDIWGALPRALRGGGTRAQRLRAAQRRGDRARHGSGRAARRRDPDPAPPRGAGGPLGLLSIDAASPSGSSASSARGSSCCRARRASGGCGSAPATWRRSS